MIMVSLFALMRFYLLKIFKAYYRFQLHLCIFHSLVLVTCLLAMYFDKEICNLCEFIMIMVLLFVLMGFYLRKIFKAYCGFQLYLCISHSLVLVTCLLGLGRDTNYEHKTIIKFKDFNFVKKK